MAKELTQEKKDKYDGILTNSKIDTEIKADKLTEEEKIEVKSYAIKQKLKLKKYVRN